MKDFSKRQYLKYTGATLAAASLGIGGTVGSGALKNVEALDEAAPQVRPRSGDRLDYERNEAGEIEFDYLDLSFESNNGDVELDDIGVDFETNLDGDELELTISNGLVELDLEMSDNGESVELTMNVGGEYIDFEFDGRRGRRGDVEFEALGNADSFEDDGEIEYKGDAIDFEWDDESGELDIKGDIKLELTTGRNRLDFEYQDDDIMIDYDTRELEYVGVDVAIDWEHNDSHPDDFEARLA
jgi:hypothetical protein